MLVQEGSDPSAPGTGDTVGLREAAVGGSHTPQARQVPIPIKPVNHFCRPTRGPEALETKLLGPRPGLCLESAAQY